MVTSMLGGPGPVVFSRAPNRVAVTVRCAAPPDSVYSILCADGGQVARGPLSRRQRGDRISVYYGDLRLRRVPASLPTQHDVSGARSNGTRDGATVSPLAIVSAPALTLVTAMICVERP